MKVAVDPLHQPGGPTTYWTTVNAEEDLAGVVTPLSSSFWMRPVTVGTLGAFGTLGVLPETAVRHSSDSDRRICTVIYGGVPVRWRRARHRGRDPRPGLLLDLLRAIAAVFGPITDEFAEDSSHPLSLDIAVVVPPLRDDLFALIDNSGVCRTQQIAEVFELHVETGARHPSFGREAFHADLCECFARLQYRLHGAQQVVAGLVSFASAPTVLLPIYRRGRHHAAAPPRSVRQRFR